MAGDVAMADVWYNIGQVAIGIGDLGLAYQAFKISISVDSNHAEFIDLYFGLPQEASLSPWVSWGIYNVWALTAMTFQVHYFFFLKVLSIATTLISS